MCLDDIPLDDLAGTNTAVIRSLGSREAILGPAERPVLKVEEGVFLLEAKPRLVFGVGLHQLGSFMAVVELVRCAVRVPALGQDDDVGLTAERIRVDGNGLEEHVRIVASRLAR